MLEYYKNIMDTVEDALESIDEEVYENLLAECEEVIKNGGKLIASGLGKNVPICEKFVGTMNSYGMDARFLHTNTAMHGDLGVVTEKDLVFLLSKSGNTQETILLAKHLVKRKCKIWGMCFNKNAEICRFIPNVIILRLDQEGDTWNIVPNNSTTVFLIVLQAIAVELSKRLHISIETFGSNHPGGNIGMLLGEE